jgi:hypothetical protein
MAAKIYKRKPDCIHYGECLTEKAVKSLQLRCGSCRRYKSSPLCLDDFVMINKEVVTVYKYEMDEIDFAELVM